MKAAFLDRDGVINEYPGDYKYVTSWQEFRFLPGVKDALKRLNDADYRIFIVSNQAGVAKGIFSQGKLDEITENMLKEIRESGVQIEMVLYCTHREEDNCNCRKPKTGLIDTVKNKLKNSGLDLTLSESYFIGDTIRDMETGRTAGLKTILIFSGKEKAENRNSWLTPPDLVAKDLVEAVELILKSRK